jgi:hypothetical protein
MRKSRGKIREAREEQTLFSYMHLGGSKSHVLSEESNTSDNTGSSKFVQLMCS